MKKGIIVIVFLLALAIQVYFLLQWFSHCLNFQGILHLDIFQLNSKVIGDINSDKGVPVWEIRLFYNKYTEGTFLILKTYFRFWDIIFLTNFLSFVGISGLFLSCWYFFCNTHKKLWQWIVLVCLLIMPCIEIFFAYRLPFTIRLFVYDVFLSGISLIGIKHFLQNNRHAVWVIPGLFIVSLWWILTGSIPYYIYCIQHALH